MKNYVEANYNDEYCLLMDGKRVHLPGSDKCDSDTIVPILKNNRFIFHITNNIMCFTCS